MGVSGIEPIQEPVKKGAEKRKFSSQIVVPSFTERILQKKVPTLVGTLVPEAHEYGNTIVTK